MAVTRLYTNPENAIPHDVAAIGKAREAIDVAAYTLTEPTMIGALVAAAQRGVSIRLYLDRTEILSEAHHDDTGAKLPIHPMIAMPNVQIRVKRSTILMHLKGYCVDSQVVRLGSANFSPLGETAQDNEASWDDDTTQIKLFELKFDQMWNRTDNLTLQAAVDLTQTERLAVARPHMR